MTSKKVLIERLGSYEAYKTYMRQIGQNGGNKRSKKLTDAQESAIRKDTRSSSVIGLEYGVSASLIRYIKNKK